MTIGLFAVLVPLLLFGRSVLDQHASKTEVPAWQRARDRWSEVYYCCRDDIVFIGDEDPEPVERLDVLLYPNGHSRV